MGYCPKIKVIPFHFRVPSLEKNHKILKLFCFLKNIFRSVQLPIDPFAVFHGTALYGLAEYPVEIVNIVIP